MSLHTRILDTLATPKTTREIADSTGAPRSRIAPELSRLVQAGRIVDGPKRKDPLTGRPVTVWVVRR